MWDYILDYCDVDIPEYRDYDSPKSTIELGLNLEDSIEYALELVVSSFFLSWGLTGEADQFVLGIGSDFLFDRRSTYQDRKRRFGCPCAFFINK